MDSSRSRASAAAIYMEALPLCPSLGISHNQLAVIATQVLSPLCCCNLRPSVCCTSQATLIHLLQDDNPFEGVYRYCRSLSVAKPFNARENLLALLEWSRKRWQKETKRLAPALQAAETGCAVPTPDKWLVGAFRLGFVRLQGILLSRTKYANSFCTLWCVAPVRHVATCCCHLAMLLPASRSTTRCWACWNASCST